MNDRSGSPPEQDPTLVDGHESRTETSVAVPPGVPRALVSVRTPGADSERAGQPVVAVTPGGTGLLVGLVRNESVIVDNYDLKVTGIPEGWWTITPQTVYLVPIGRSEAHEQQVQIMLHPPRSPAAEARPWPIVISATSHTSRGEVATAAATLIIEPYHDIDYAVLPQLAHGRLGARFEAFVVNRANAPAEVAVSLTDDSQQLRFEGSGRIVTFAAFRHALMPFVGRFRRDLSKDAAHLLAPPAAPNQLPGGQLVQQQVRQAKTSVREGANERAAGALSAATRPGAELAQPVVLLVATGDPASMRFVARPDRQIWIGRPVQHRLGVAAKVVGDEAPVIPRAAVFHQRPWLPAWLPIVAVLIALAVIAFLALRPKTVTVPNLRNASSPFVAQQKLQSIGLTLNPSIQSKVDPAARPGSIIAQTPAAGSHVAKHTAVAIETAAANGSTVVPKLRGRSVAQADQMLTQAGLTLGTVMPKPDPNGIIASQIPTAGDRRRKGTPVNVFLAPPKKPKKAAAATGATGQGASPASAAPAAVAVAPAAGAAAAAYNAKLTSAGLLVTTTWTINPAKRGTVVSTTPAAGTKLQPGATVSEIVSAGFPDVAFADGGGVRVVSGTSGAQIAHFGNGGESSPTWSPDGTEVAYSTGETVLASQLKHPRQPPQQVIAAKPGVVWSDPVFAPSRTANVIAAAQSAGSSEAICFVALHGASSSAPSCLAAPGWHLGQIGWSPDGRSLLVSASSPTNPGTFGLLRFTTGAPFVANASLWSSTDVLVTPAAGGQGSLAAPNGRGVLAAQISPDGKSLGVISNLNGGPFRVGLTSPTDLSLKKLRLLPLVGCDLAWRSDSGELAVVSGDPACGTPTGLMLGLDPNQPRSLTMLAYSGERPSWQPVRLGP